VRAGAGEAEAYAQRETGREIRVHNGEVESFTAATERGIGVRAWIGKRVGYAFGTDLSEDGLDEVAARAATAARVSDEDDSAGPPEPDGAQPELSGIRDPEIGVWQGDRLVEIPLEIERAALRHDKRVSGVEQAVYADADEEVAIHSSTGVMGRYETSSCYAYLQALAEGEGAKETGLGFGLARGPGGLDPEAIGREGAERAAAMIGAGKPASRACPVLFDPTVAASFAGLIGSVLGADTVQRGRSPFAQLLGEEVASDELLLHDDGLDPEGLQSSPCDDEGTPRSRTALVEGGRLRTFLHDTYTARRGNASPTGNAGRSGYRSAPSVSTSNLVIGTGRLSFAELLAAMGEGVYVTDVAGLHSGVNPVSGVFSVGASGRMVSGGEPTEPVREFTIASDLVSMLQAVREAGSEHRWVPFGGSVRTPPLLIGEMTVSGT
jgi:PmbA protein